jgi:hypothetical protein
MEKMTKLILGQGFLDDVLTDRFNPLFSQGKVLGREEGKEWKIYEKGDGNPFLSEYSIFVEYEAWDWRETETVIVFEGKERLFVRLVEGTADRWQVGKFISEHSMCLEMAGVILYNMYRTR